MEKTFFGKTKEGLEVTKYTCENKNGMKLSVIDLGATITGISLKDASGQEKDVLLGYDTPEEYQTNTCYFGAVIGRNANRIDQGRLVLDGTEYQLEQNDNENNLHSGSKGFHAVIWKLEECSAGSLTFTYTSKDLEQGFPGTMQAKVIYELTDDNEVVITYEAVSDKTTVANFTNHAYFNLDGHDSGNVEGQSLEILASYYTPVKDSKAIPTGEIAGVSGTPMDFRQMKEIGQDIHADFEQLTCSGGYDHNYVLDKADGTMQFAARAKGKNSGITMDVYTDCKGIQFYSGNFITKQQGKGGAVYDFRQGFCLETQYFPNAVNDRNFEAPILKKGDVYHSSTKYSFLVR